ncbi:MAG: lytic transglycosylase domain-containing protein, partial [Acidobacteria bacterium]|nr:lytic transglycosylase domain-containing protein [Acidobacteriota bacterium]
LLRCGEAGAARREWRRLGRVQLTPPGQALAAAALEAGGPDPSRAIRWLRAADPRLGTIEMSRCPSDLLRAYLPLRWRDEISGAARETGLDPWLIAALARQESTFAPHALSPRGAIGLLQLIPRTARRHARALGLGPQPDLRDPTVNLRLGARELASLIDRFGALEPALAAYNGGATRVAKWWKRWPDPRRFTEEIPVPETYTYVRRVIFLSGAYRRLYAAQWRNHD